MKRKIFFGISMLAVIAGISSMALHHSTIEVKADSGTIYDCSTYTSTAFPASYDGICYSSSSPFGSEALNLYEFFVDGQGINLAGEGGVLPEDDSGWTAATLSLLTYPMYSNTSLGTKFNQYPLGWRMNTADMKGQTGAWPDGSYSASMSYGAYDTSGWIHPDDGFGLVIYFVAPSAGTVYITDTVSAPGSGSDGTYMCIYKIPAASYPTRSWNSQTHHGLSGGSPIYPTAGVSPTSNWGTGWKHIGATSETYFTRNITVEAGDAIAWIYGAGLTTTSDATYTSPKVVYGTSPINEAETFENDYVYAPNGTPIAYTDNTDTGACKGDSGYYAAAKTAYNALSTNAKSIFKSDSQFANARARLQAWAVANGETIDFSSGSNAFISNSATTNNNASIIVIVSTLVISAVITARILTIKRRKQR